MAQNIRFLSRQGIALRGDADESDGNFMQLMHLRAIDDTTINDMLKKTNKYTSPQIQNELLNMSLHILREIASSLQHAHYFAIMVDEVTDLSNKEQLVVCFRSVDHDFQPTEEFVGLHHVESINADALVRCLKDTMLRMNLSIHNCRAQCYDGAANMCGSYSGASTDLCRRTKSYFHALLWSRTQFGC